MGRLRKQCGDGVLLVRHAAELAMVGFTLLLFWRPLFGGEAFFWGTPMLQFVPWQRLAASMWRSGYVPLWNPLVGCGAPLAANYQTAAFYPLNALYLFLPAEVALSWTVALHVTLAGWGMLRWGRSVGLDRPAAFVGALAVQGSGFLVARAALFPSIALAFPWMAIWLWRGEVLVQRGGWRQALWLSLAVGMGLLAGHAQTAFYGGVLLAAYLAFRVAQQALRGEALRGEALRGEGVPGRGSGRRPGWSFLAARGGLALCAVALGAGLAAVQLVPTAELLAQSQRSSGVAFEAGLTYSMWPWRLLTLAAPNLFGNPGHGDYWGYAAYWEDAAYVGLVPLLLAMELVFRRRRAGGVAAQAWFWLVAAVAATVLALGRNTPVFPLLYHHVPGFDLFNAPARWLAVTTVALAALAALGMQHWPGGPHDRRRGSLGLVVGIALVLGGLAAPRLVPGIRATFGPATVWMGVLLLAAGGLRLLRCRAAWWQMALGGLIALDLLVFGWPLVPTVDGSLYAGETDTAHDLAGASEPVRVYWPTDPQHVDRAYDAEYRVKFAWLTFDDFGPRDVNHWRALRAAWIPNASMLDGVACANNFDPLLVGRYEEMLQVVKETPDLVPVMGVTHVAVDHPAREGGAGAVVPGYEMRELERVLGRAWVVPSARQVPVEEMAAALASPSFDPVLEVLVEGPVTRGGEPGAVDGGGWSVALHEAPNRVTIAADLDTPGYLVLADTWYPGWHATVNGAQVELLRANLAYRAIRLGAGEQVVEMVYRPVSLLLGCGVSLVALAVVVVGLAWRRRPEAPV